MKVVPTIARVLSISTALLLGATTVASAQIEPTIEDNGTGDARMLPLTDTVPAIEAGATGWIAINWTAENGEARDVRVTATGSEGVDVGYPTYPVDGYSSGMRDEIFSVSEIDYTALKITVAGDAPSPRSLEVRVTYTSDSGDHADEFDMVFEGDGEPTPPTTAPPTTAPVTTAPATTAPATTAPATTTPTTSVESCDVIVIDSFLQAPFTFTFQVRNTSNRPANFEFTVPNTNYQLANLIFNGSGTNLELEQSTNSDGSSDVVITGTIPAYQSVGGIQVNGFLGTLIPRSDTPVVNCTR